MRELCLKEKVYRSSTFFLPIKKKKRKLLFTVPSSLSAYLRTIFHQIQDAITTLLFYIPLKGKILNKLWQVIDHKMHPDFQNISAS